MGEEETEKDTWVEVKKEGIIRSVESGKLTTGQTGSEDAHPKILLQNAKKFWKKFLIPIIFLILGHVIVLLSKNGPYPASFSFIFVFYTAGFDAYVLWFGSNCSPNCTTTNPAYQDL